MFPFLVSRARALSHPLCFRSYPSFHPPPRFAPPPERPFNSWDRQPFAMTKDLAALPVPAVTNISNNFIFGDYSGIKALDHDDGSSFYHDFENVIYMGWGQKTFEPSPGAKRTFNSLFLFATATLLTEHGGETAVEFAEHFENNTIVFAPNGGSVNYGSIDRTSQLTDNLLQLRNNKFFTANESFRVTVNHNNLEGLEALQKLGAEAGSTLTTTLPSDEALVAAAKVYLGLPPNIV